MFQFYLSSIKSYDEVYGAFRSTCFNSTLVQLKDGKNIVYLLLVICFNSTLVQLKVDFKEIMRNMGI